MTLPRYILISTAYNNYEVPLNLYLFHCNGTIKIYHCFCLSFMILCTVLTLTSKSMPCERGLCSPIQHNVYAIKMTSYEHTAARLVNLFFYSIVDIRLCLCIYIFNVFACAPLANFLRINNITASMNEWNRQTRALAKKKWRYASA